MTVGVMVKMMTTTINNSLSFYWNENSANNNPAVFTLAEMNRMATWNH